MTIVHVKAAKLHLYDISFDDGATCSIDKSVWEHSGFREGDEMSDEVRHTLCELSQTHRAREKALYYLSLRDYGKRELIQKLMRAGIARDLAEQTVEPLAQSGIIDDTRYAAALARDMCTRKLYPRRRVAMALKEKGFDNEAIESALLQLPEEDVQQALELLRKKRYNKPNGSVPKEKQLAMLARYGFSYGTAARALALLEEERDDSSEDEGV